MKLKTTAALALLITHLGWAQAETIYAPKQGERLSELLMRQQLLPGSARNAQGQALQLEGMVLQRAALRSKQALQKTQLITQLAVMGPSKVPAYLQPLLDGLPVTGRQLLPSQDGHVLAAKINLDPILQNNDQLVLQPVGNTIAVLGTSGQCIAEFKPEVSVLAYLEQCFPKSSWYQFGEGFDQAWLVQPSGEVTKLNVGLWNQTEQTLPQPGAWVWAPARNSGWAEQESLQLVQFLQTQGAYKQPADTTVQPPVVEAPEADAIAANNTPFDYTVRPTRSDWGTVGLLQMPSARMAEEGTISITASRVEPYSRYSFIYQPFEWLEAGFRYSIITNRRFGSDAFSGDRKYQDKSVDLKVRLLDETAYVPEVAMGLRDIGGTGLFSSEYFVANKRAGKFDFTLGLGFGNMASGGGISNPFGFITDEFDTRPAPDVGVGGQANSSAYFRGEAALFGGVEWQTPWQDLIFKVEVDGNDYSNEPLNNPQAQSSNINYGAVYRINDYIDLSVSVQRGNTMGFALSFKENVSKYAVPKITDPKPVVVTQGPRPTSTDWEKTVKLVEQQTTWNVESVQQRGSEVQLTVKNADVTYPGKAVDKATAALHENVAEGINWFSFNYKNRGADVAQHVVNRKQWAADKTELPVEQTNSNPVAAVEPNSYTYRPVHTDYDPWYNGGVGLGYEQTFGGANGYLFQFTGYARGEIEFTDSTWVTGRIDHVLGGTFDKFTQRGTSRLPQVRTNFREYSTASDTKLSNLQLNHVGQLSQNHFYSLYGGYLESMFGGVGGEYLYRPMNSRWALGVDVNRVKQRAFEQDFGFRNYSVNTGHITAYVDTGFEDILATVSVGQYLAGDKGVTVDLSRVFDNGVRIGAYATKTNVSAEDFGEGSFDKGIYLRVPFDALFTSTVPGDASFNWVQVTRDGGAKLRRALSLFEETGVRSPRVFRFKAAIEAN
ncbi:MULTISPECIES: YjbH domain-containing protein [unclassified Limnobacter]|uniref:YjbH domain-containing protein n=4 Tax=Limnobacter TaxID=131079 RepID=UPI0025C2C2DB|nr:MULTISPECIES: YjbH domain-containing protein [unclassified Limnobacter]|tara:strand:+ start:23386 stop:26223 length:2838 start_codon:yes stop_codon:yes gene_type:complete